MWSKKSVFCILPIMLSLVTAISNGEIPDHHAFLSSGYHLHIADSLYKVKDYNKALEYSKKSQKLYKSLQKQEERKVKIYSQMGRIFIKLNEYDKAKDIFRKGLQESIRISRLDEQARNLLYLGEVLIFEKEYKSAKDKIEKSLVLFCEMGLKKEIEKANELLSKIHD